MTTYRAGQRVRIEGRSWAIEGILFTGPQERLFVDQPGDDYGWPIDEWTRWRANVTVAVLSEPRPDEPTGLGAVVEASLSGFGGRSLWLRTFDGHWACDQWITPVEWYELVDPVIKSDGHVE